MKRVFYTVFDSGLVGKLYIASTEMGICRLVIDNTGEEAFVRTLAYRLNCPIDRDEGFFSDLFDDLRDYFEGKRVRFRSKVDLTSGTDFQKKVWSVLQEVPYGEIRSYKWLAGRVGNEKATRAVGAANGRNPVPIIIPCHRIISSSGKLGGYSAGVGIKEKLLRLEGAI